MQLIDKDTLVAEIDLRINNLESTKKAGLISKRNANERIGILRGILSLIDTLEVKKVDLEKEYKDFVEEDPVYNKLVNGIVGKAIAKHFFELGLRASLTEEKYKGNVKGSYTTTTEFKT